MLLETIPSEWQIPSDKLPAETGTSVIDFTTTCGILSKDELSIIASDVADLLSATTTGKLTCLEVMTAFCKAAAVAHQLTNCLTEIFFTPALDRAKELDGTFAKTGKPTGALFGLPISLKDQFQIKGTECNVGIASWIGQISSENSVLVDILLDAGAVLHCRTNLPQGIMFAETDNYVYGPTTNPHKRTLTCGGSSGGEGALVAMRGTAIGVGTDLGGSIRIPSAYNGLYGLRPTIHRLPYRLARNTLLGMESISSSLGPMANSMSGIHAFTKAVVESEPWSLDPKTPEIAWRPDMVDLKHLMSRDGRPRKPVFGVMRWDGYVKPWPPIRRAIDIAVSALRDAGYEIIEFDCPFDSKKSESIIGRIYSSDGGEELKRTFAVSGEPRHPLMLMPEDAPHLSVYENWQLNLEKYEVQDAWLDAWNKTAERTSTGLPMDGVVLPAGANVAHKIGEWPMYAPFFRWCRTARSC